MTLIVPVVTAQVGWVTLVVATAGVGFTVIVKVCATPVQPPKIGVTAIVAVTAVDPAFTAVKAGIVLTPVWFASPTELPPDTLKVTPEGVPAKA